MLFFTVEVELEPDVCEGFGDMSSELKGIELTRILCKATGNRTWHHMMDIPKAEPFLTECKRDPTTGNMKVIETPFQWDDEINRVEVHAR